MYRLIMLAVLMLGVIGGLTVMLGSSPLAAQAGPSATRSVDLSTVEPGETVTVTIDVAAYGLAGQVSEELPDGFEFVPNSITTATPPTLGFATRSEAADIPQGVVVIQIGGISSFSYQLTASSMEGIYEFSGNLEATNKIEYPVVGDTEVTVSADATTPDPEATPVATGYLKFDVVPAKAVKGAVVSGLNASDREQPPGVGCFR